ncbi:unnamed protein product [Arctogadus glacialis]
MGWFQTPSVKQRLRSPKLDLHFWRGYCQDIFGKNIKPHTSRGNTQLGGTSLNVRNLIMTNGNEDPWRWAGLQQNQSDVESFVIECDNSAHCIDLGTPSDSDCDQLKEGQFLQLEACLVQQTLSYLANVLRRVGKARQQHAQPSLSSWLFKYVTPNPLSRSAANTRAAFLTSGILSITLTRSTGSNMAKWAPPFSQSRRGGNGLDTQFSDPVCWKPVFSARAASHVCGVGRQPGLEHLAGLADQFGQFFLLSGLSSLRTTLNMWANSGRPGTSSCE